jgi:hypothetical protein
MVALAACRLLWPRNAGAKRRAQEGQAVSIIVLRQ